MRVDRIYEKESFAVAHVVFSHGAVCRAVRSNGAITLNCRTFVLSGCIQYRQKRLFIIDPALFDICIPVRPINKLIPRRRAVLWEFSASATKGT